jgi:hypothetical protein
MSEAWDNPNLSNHAEKLVLVCLADFANDEGECWPKVETVARKCNLSEGGARAVIKRLSDRGFLTIEQHSGRGKSNGYRLHISRGKAEIEPVKPNGENPFKKKVFVKPNLENPFVDAKPNGENPFVDEGLYKDEPSGLIYEPSVCVRAHENSPPKSKPKREPYDMDGADDKRYHSAHFSAVLEACGLNAKLISLDNRARIRAAATAEALAENGYTPEQIRHARTAWKLDDAPTPQQLGSQIDKLLERAGPPPGNPGDIRTADGKLNIAAIRAYGKGAQHEQR